MLNKARTELRNFISKNQTKIAKTFNVKVPLTIVNMNNGKFTDWIYENLLNFQQFHLFDEKENAVFIKLLNNFISINEEIKTKEID